MTAAFSFILSAILCIFGALYALHARELMRAVLGLAVLFIGITGFFGLLGATYLAVAQLFLFVGGVVTLFVLAFNVGHTAHMQRTTLVAALLSIAVLSIMAVFLPGLSEISSTISLVDFAEFFFTKYGLVVNAALLLLFSGLMSAQYLLEDDS